MRTYKSNFTGDEQGHVWVNIFVKGVFSTFDKDVKVPKDKTIQLEDWQQTEDFKNKVRLGLLVEVKSFSTQRI